VTAPPLGAKRHAAGTNASIPVEECQVCGCADLEPVIFVGYLPPVNTMPPLGERPLEKPAYPAQILRCPRCELVQLGTIVDPAILFPPDYAYTSGTTKILRENFAELYVEATALVPLAKDDLIVDIGSNDGTLLRNFADRGHRVLGIEPTDVGKLAAERGIPTRISFFTPAVADEVVATHGPARIVTATNVFAHIEDIHGIVDGLVALLGDDGVFISESHYWLGLLETLQYDTIYHEHLRHYSLGSLRYLLAMHGLDVFHAKRIPTHGSSIRVYAGRAGRMDVRPSVAVMLAIEERELTAEKLARFRHGVTASKLGLYAILREVKARGGRVYGVGAPSRASTLVNYVGLDEGIVDCVVEVTGSHKIGKYMPGTLIPVLDERKLLEDQPEYALLLSWHIADELMATLRSRGYQGDFIVPLPEPRMVRGASGPARGD
jgi:hypothetical protein